MHLEVQFHISHYPAYMIFINAYAVNVDTFPYASVLMNIYFHISC